MTLIITAALLLASVLLIKLGAAQDEQQCFEHQFDSSFIPGYSCEDIYNKNSQSRDMSGYYWITDGLRRVYCGMNYAGSSCESIFNNYRGSRDKSGYYRINNNEWAYCNMTAIAIAFSRGDLTSSCVGVDGVVEKDSWF